MIALTHCKKLAISMFLLVSVYSLAQEKRTYEIGVLADFTSAEAVPVFNKIRSEITAVVGEDAIIVFPTENQLVNNYDRNVAESNYEKLINKGTDIILAFGPVNSMVITQQKEHPVPTILFGAVTKDFSDLDFTNLTSGIHNFTYLVQSQSYEEDISKLHELTNFKKLGFAADKKYSEIFDMDETLSKILSSLNSNYKLIPFDTTQEILDNLEDCDALYLAGGFFLNQESIDLLAAGLIDKNIPSFSANGVEDVRSGLMATNQTEENFDQFFRRLALTVEAYVNGTELADLPVYIESNSKLTMNYNTARAIGVPIKFSLIGETDFVGGIRNVRSEVQYDLLQVIDSVINRNLNLQAVEKDVALTEQDVRSARSNYLPSLTAAANGTYTDPNLAEVSNGQSPEFQTAGNITLQQTLFSEAANANISVQKNLQKAQQENYNAEQLTTIFNAANVYFNILILKANAQIQIRNLDLTKYNLRIATQNFEAGEAGKTDLLRFRSQMAQNTQSMVESINQLQQGFVSLNQLLNNPLTTEIDISDVTLDEGIFEAYNYDQLVKLLDDPLLREPFIEFLTLEAKNNAPELKSLNYNLEATERTIKLNSAGRLLPTLALQGQYNRVFDRSGIGSTPPPGISFPDDNYQVSLNLSIPIINQNLTNVNRQIGIIQKDQLTITRENTELAIDANIRNSVLNLVNQISNIELSKISEETAEESLEITQASYSAGAVNIVQLIDAQNNYLNAQLARANAVYNYLITMLELERNLGYYFLLNSPEDNADFTRRFIEFTNNRN